MTLIQRRNNVVCPVGKALAVSRAGIVYIILPILKSDYVQQVIGWGP